MGKCPLLSIEDSWEFMRVFLEQVNESARSRRERYMNPQNVLKFSHGHSWEAPANELGDKSGTFEKLAAELEIQLSDIAEGRAQVIFDAIDQVALSIHDQMERRMLETMVEATERTGKVVDAAGRPVLEAIYEMLDKMELSLGEDGELAMPSLFVHPSQAPKILAELNSAGPETKERIELLKERKKEAAHIKEQDRLSRFERLGD